MAYQFDTYDNSVVLNGEENGIADSPYAGIANIVNANITSIPGEVSVGFSTKNMTAPSRITGNITSVSTSTGLFQFNNSQLFLENGMAIYFDSISGIFGITTSIPYWIFGITNNNGSGSFYLTSSYSLDSGYYCHCRYSEKLRGHRQQGVVDHPDTHFACYRYGSLFSTWQEEIALRN